MKKKNEVRQLIKIK